MTNFDFLLSEPGFQSFAQVAMAAEKILHIDPAACILNCRRALEFAAISAASERLDLRASATFMMISMVIISRKITADSALIWGLTFLRTIE